MLNHQLYNFNIFFLSILYQCLGIAPRLPGIGDQIIYMIHNVLVCYHDGRPVGHFLRSRRVEQAVKAFRLLDGPLCWIIRKQQGQLHFWVPSLRLFHCPGSKAVKPAIVPYDEFPHPKFCDMAIHFSQQCRVNGIRGISIVSGRNRSATISTIKKLCDGLGITIEQFFDSDLFRDLDQELQ